MSWPISSNNFAVGAEHHWVKYFHHVHKFDPFGTLEVAWILAKAPQVKQQCQTKQSELDINENELVIVEREKVHELYLVDEEHEEPHDSRCLVWLCHKFQGRLEHQALHIFGLYQVSFQGFSQIGSRNKFSQVNRFATLIVLSVSWCASNQETSDRPRALQSFHTFNREVKRSVTIAVLVV